MLKAKAYLRDLPTLGIIALTLFGALLRLIALSYVGTFTFDDLFSVHFASKPIGEMLGLLKDEVHPPLYYLFLHFWIQAFGQVEWVVRLPSVLFSVACIPLLYWLSKKISNVPIALGAAGLFAVSYFQIFSAIEVRMYSLLMLLGLASLFFVWLFLFEQRVRLWPWYVVISIALLYTHLGGIFAIVTAWLWFFLLRRSGRVPTQLRKKFFLTQAIIIGAWLPWLVPLFLPKIYQLWSTGWYFAPGAAQNPAVGLFDFFLLGLRGYLLRLITATIILSAPFLVWLWPDKKLQLAGGVSSSWLLLAWIGPAILTAVASQLSLTRIFIVGYLGWYIVVAYCFWIIWHYRRWLGVTLGIIWLVAVVIVLTSHLRQSLSRWDLADSWLHQQSGVSTILSYPFTNQLLLSRYYSGTLPYAGVYPLQDTLSFDERLVQKNWQRLVTADSLAALPPTLPGSGKIIVVHEAQQPDQYQKTAVHQWLIAQHWQIIGQFVPTESWFGPRLILYQR